MIFHQSVIVPFSNAFKSTARLVCCTCRYLHLSYLPPTLTLSLPPTLPHTLTPSHTHTFTPSHTHTFTPSHTHTDVLSQSSLPSEGTMAVKKNGRFSLETFPLCDPRHFLHRYSLLILMCFLSFGNYFVYDNPASLPKVIKNVSRISVSIPRVLEPDPR